MRKLLALVASAVLFMSQLQAQSISPDVDSEQCPGEAISFEATIPDINLTIVGVMGVSNSVAPNVNPGWYSTQTFNTTTIYFTGNFVDENRKQTFRISYYDQQNGQVVQYKDFSYSKIKSFKHQEQVSTPTPLNPVIIAERCQMISFNISFANVQFKNAAVFPTVTYGVANNYEYLLPTGWQLNGNTSTGSNWIGGSNNVTVTSDLSNGDQSKIKIRAINPCGTSFYKGPEGEVAISRPEPSLSISGQNYICSGSQSYTLNNLPSGALVSWNVSNNTELSVQSLAPSTSPYISVTRIGTANTRADLIATVTHCTFTYTRVFNISLGTPVVNDVAVSYPTIGCLQMGYNIGYRPSYNVNGPDLYDYVWGYYPDQSGGVLTPVLPAVSSGNYLIRIPNTLQYNRIYVAGENPCGVGVPAIKVFEFSSYCDGGGDVEVSTRLRQSIIPEDTKDNNLFSIYPNPAANNVIIKLSLPVFDKSVAKIYDISGKEVKRVAIAGNATIINIAEFPKGVYVIELTNGKQVLRKKMIKN